MSKPGNALNSWLDKVFDWSPKMVGNHLHLKEDMARTINETTFHLEPHRVVDKDDELHDALQVLQVPSLEAMLTCPHLEKPIGCCEPFGCVTPCLAKKNKLASTLPVLMASTILKPYC